MILSDALGFYKKRMGLLSSTTIGNTLKTQSDIISDYTFDRDIDYRVGMIYDANLQPLEENPIEFKFQKAKDYTINKDQVEYYVQFKSDYHPEKKYFLWNDGIERLNFYLDIADDVGDIQKWLILGRNFDGTFVKYNVLKCNWLFEWMIGRKYYSCLGVVRDASSYNSGLWSDGITTSLQNETMFFVPNNDNTRTIHYDVRFMITDNPIHPKTYSISKAMDTFPLGCIKFTLTQDAFNPNTDICKILNDSDAPSILKDGKIHKICNYISSLPPIVEEESSVWYLSEVGKKLYINGSAQVITALKLNDVGDSTFDNEWKLYLDNELYAAFDSDNTNLKDEYLNVSLDISKNTLTVKAINKDLAKYVLKVEIGNKENKNYYDSVEMEVSN